MIGAQIEPDRNLCAGLPVAMWRMARYRTFNAGSYGSICVLAA